MAGGLPDLGSAEAALLVQVNAARHSATLNPLASNPQLTAAARDYARLLAASGQFKHTADETIEVRAARSGYMACAVAENLALRRGSDLTPTSLAQSTLTGWLASPVHHRNLMARHMTQTGIGVAVAPPQSAGGAPTAIVVELFARPLSQGLAFRIDNQTSLPVTFAVGGQPKTLSPRAALKFTSCAAPSVNFERAGSAVISSRYDASDGVVYRVTGSVDTGIHVEVGR